jgi:hypothetical protein
MPLSANNPGLRYAPLLDADSSQDFLAAAMLGNAVEDATRCV